MEEQDKPLVPSPSEMPARGPSGLLQGFVAQVLNERELVINIGREQGVKPGMRFKVLAQEKLQILDPINHEPLGDLERDKVRVEAIEVHDRMAVCKTYESWTVGGQLNTAQILQDAMFGPTRRVFETLSAEIEAKPAPLSEDESYVKIGDRVLQLPRRERDE